jgi:hypothetical protein
MRPGRLLPLTLVYGCGFADPIDADVGDAAQCEEVETWERAWTEMEEDLAHAIASARGAGGPCGDTEIGQTAVVEMSPPLRCAARLHARWMGKRVRDGHEGPGGETPAERIFAAGYEGIPRGQLTADRYDDAEAALNAWFDDPEQCATLRDIGLDDVGVGVWRTSAGRFRWVLTLGSRRKQQ